MNKFEHVGEALKQIAAHMGERLQPEDQKLVERVLVELATRVEGASPPERTLSPSEAALTPKAGFLSRLRKQAVDRFPAIDEAVLSFLRSQADDAWEEGCRYATPREPTKESEALLSKILCAVSTLTPWGDVRLLPPALMAREGVKSPFPNTPHLWGVGVGPRTFWAPTLLDAFGHALREEAKRISQSVTDMDSVSKMFVASTTPPAEKPAG